MIFPSSYHLTLFQSGHFDTPKYEDSKHPNLGLTSINSASHRQDINSFKTAERGMEYVIYKDHEASEYPLPPPAPCTCTEISPRSSIMIIRIDWRQLLSFRKCVQPLQHAWVLKRWTHGCMWRCIRRQLAIWTRMFRWAVSDVLGSESLRVLPPRDCVLPRRIKLLSLWNFL